MLITWLCTRHSSKHFNHAYFLPNMTGTIIVCISLWASEKQKDQCDQGQTDAQI